MKSKDFMIIPQRERLRVIINYWWNLG